MFRYLISKEFWLTILGLTVLGVLGFLAFFYWFLPSYTRHAESVVVPDVSKMTIAQADSALKDQGLVMEIADSVYRPGVPPLSVVNQEPAGLSKVKPGRKIYLSVNKSVPPMIKFPDVLYVSHYQAKMRLESWGFSISRLDPVPYEFRNVVLGVTLDGKKVKAGESLPKGTRVVLQVGRGLGSNLVGVPDLMEMPYEKAISILLESGLNIGSLKFKPDAEGDKGTVIRQNPEFYPGDSLPMGSGIDLFIAGPEPEEAFELPLLGDDFGDSTNVGTGTGN